MNLIRNPLLALRNFLPFFIILLLSYSVTYSVSDSDRDTALESFYELLEIQRLKIAGINDIFSQFNQIEEIGDARIKREKSGRLWARSDGSFRVEYLMPEEIVMIFDREYLVQHYVQDNDVQAVKADEMDNRTNPFYLWFNLDNIEELYEIIKCREAEGYRHITLRDRKEGSIISHIGLFIDIETGYLKRIESVDESNNTKTTIQFSNYRINTAQTNPELFIIPEELLERKSASPALFYE